MRKLVYYVVVTLDGFIAGPDGGDPIAASYFPLPEDLIELIATETADPVQTVRALKAEDGLDIWIVGGGKLAHALLPEIDRLILKQHASVIGSGVPLFDGPFQPWLFRPTELRQLDSGVRVLSFDRR